MTWADSHCHVHDDRVGGAVDGTDVRVADEVLRAAAEENVGLVITVGTDRATALAAQQMAAWATDHGSSGVEVWATAGLHPHDAVHGWEWLEPMLEEASLCRVVAVGECGLDYYYDHSPREMQIEAFAAQVALAHRFGLPLVIHTRDAWKDTFSVLRSEGVPAETIFHCFTGGADEARACLELGAYLSYSGIVTFKTANDLREAARLTPLDRLLVETDAPYLAPVPHRGKANRPAWVPLVGACVAAVKNVDVESVESATYDNTRRAFELPKVAPTNARDDKSPE